MNLADAIRLAVQHKEQGTQMEPEPVPYTMPTEMSAIAQQTEEIETMNQPNDQNQLLGTTVRLEMYLTPDQLSNLFRAVASSQHAMLTAREAASFLRIPVHSLETLAGEGAVPGFQIDGRWRFSKQAIEEWSVARQQANKEAA